MFWPIALLRRSPCGNSFPSTTSSRRCKRGEPYLRWFPPANPFPYCLYESSTLSMKSSILRTFLASSSFISKVNFPGHVLVTVNASYDLGLLLMRSLRRLRFQDHYYLAAVFVVYLFRLLWVICSTCLVASFFAF